MKLQGMEYVQWLCALVLFWGAARFPRTPPGWRGSLNAFGFYAFGCFYLSMAVSARYGAQLGERVHDIALHSMLIGVLLNLTVMLRDRIARV